MNKAKFCLPFFLLSMLICVNTLFSQTKPISLAGSANLSQDFYSVDGLENRRPGNVSRAIMRMTISVYDQVQIPFELYLSSEENRFSNPFNQFGVSPQITDWLKFHGGYFSTKISNLTFGDLRILGGGVELTPGNFRLKFIYGRSNDGIETDSSRGFKGTYDQMLYATSIGYLFGEKSFLNFNLMHAVDDSTTLKYSSFKPAPTENLNVSLNFGIRFSSLFRLEGEAGIGAFTNNTQADSLSTDISVPSFLFNPNYSSQVDGAAILSLYITPAKVWGFSLNTRWIGPGYITQGYAQLQNDVLEFNIAPYVHLLNRRLNINGTLGYKSNNLRDNHIAKTERSTGSLNIGYQITDKLGVNFLYNYNGIKTAGAIDSFKVSNIFNLFSISPRYMFNAFTGMNNIMLNYTSQSAIDENPLTKSSTAYDTKNISYIHSIHFPSTLNFTLNLLFSETSLSERTIEIMNFNGTVGHQFFENKLSTSVGLGYNIVTTIKKDYQTLFQVFLSYSLGNLGTLSFNLTNNNYRASAPYSPSYAELNGSFQYSISF